MDTQRHKYGDPAPFTGAVDSGTVIEIGDLVYLETDDVRPASSQAAGSALANTQESFHDKFFGVAAQRSRNGDTDPIRVDTGGVHEFPCDSTNWEIGDLVGVAESSAFALEDQKVVRLGAFGAGLNNRAIGKCAQRGTGLTKVMVRIESTVMTGGPKAMA